MKLLTHRFYVFLLLGMFYGLQSFGQINYGLKAGANFSKYNNDYFKILVGGLVGGYVNFPLNSKISLQPELLYSMEGATAIGVNERMNFINVPVY